MPRKIAEPRLTASEACHRLALREGQKENKEERPVNKNGEKQMKRIVTVTVVLITLLAATAILVSLVHPWTNATTIREDFSDTVGYPGPDNFCMCCHTDLNTLEDCCVGMSITGDYDPNYPSGPCYYNYGSWMFTQEVSYDDQWNSQVSWWFYPSPSSSNACEYEVMYKGTSYYAGNSFYDSSTPEYYGSYGAVTLLCTYPSNGTPMQFSPDATSLNGQSYGAFYLYSNPSDILYLSAGPTGSFYSIETAQPGPPVPTASTWYASG